MASTQKKLSNKFLTEIREVLSEHGFSSEDFIIVSKNEDTIKIDITYKYNKEYFIEALMLDSASSSDIFINYSPGEVTSPQEEEDLSKDEFLESISKWTLNLREELKSTTLGRKIYENEAKLKDLEDFVNKKFTENEDTYFSKEEGNMLKERLDEFEKIFQEQMEKQNNKDQKVHNEVQLLKEQIEYLTKRNWTTTIGAKILNWGTRNPQVVENVGRAALTAILPEEIRNSFPELLPPSSEE